MYQYDNNFFRIYQTLDMPRIYTATSIQVRNLEIVHEKRYGLFSQVQVDAIGN